ncbi:MAG: hypothetical protein ABJC07_07320 [Acidobacteriota bacterium]
MPADESLAYYWASIGFSAAGVVLFLWLMRAPGRPDPEKGIADRESKAGPETASPGRDATP